MVHELVDWLVVVKVVHLVVALADDLVDWK